jgi:lipoyl(octanoyl) transferase 2
MSLPPVLYHIFKKPLPYSQTLRLQERIQNLQFRLRESATHPDVLLLLQHRPVYTAGRRQTEEEINDERKLLMTLGADFELTDRGGQTTFHGPGQIVGYPLLDLDRPSPVLRTRDYVCRLQKMLQNHLLEQHGIQSASSEHTGVFLDPHTKIASIGLQLRHRMTTHGFAINVTREPLAWFDRVVACGLADVKAGCTAKASKHSTVNLADEYGGLVNAFSKIMERDVAMLDSRGNGELETMIQELELEAERAGSWHTQPLAAP